MSEYEVCTPVFSFYHELVEEMVAIYLRGVTIPGNPISAIQREGN